MTPNLPVLPSTRDPPRRRVVSTHTESVRSTGSSDTKREGPTNGLRGVEGDGGGHPTRTPGPADQSPGLDAELAQQFEQTFIGYDGGSGDVEIQDDAPNQHKQQRKRFEPQPDRSTLINLTETASNPTPSRRSARLSLHLSSVSHPRT